jgi:hypothetical protein
MYNLFDHTDPWKDVYGARDVIVNLNLTINAAVNSVQKEAPDNLRLNFVDVNYKGSPFEKHGICSDQGESYFRNVDQVANNKNYIFHPNEKGQEAYSQIVMNTLKVVK